ncbi:MAG: class II fructose-bisphosphate aldolase [Candidatus Onthovivens sp.]|nr:class II fructose-bisphosphate aldolase [Candidatus Onthovivens sp.]
MLASLKEVLNYAEKNNCAIGSFNTPTLESLNAVINAAEKLNVPVIIMHAQCHENEAPLHNIGPVMVLLAKLAKVPVCVHLDHGETFEYLKEAIDLGFTSVMIDGSALPYEDNVSLTKKVVAFAHERNVDVEAEIGILGGREAGDRKLTKEEMYTDPELAKKFVEETHIDALACSFGTAHGFYTVAPKLDFPRIAKIKELCNIPLVMHGGSGVNQEDYKEAIALGVRKINYYSYMAREGLKGAKEALDKEVKFFHELSSIATNYMEKDVLRAMNVFYNK